MSTTPLAPTLDLPAALRLADALRAARTPVVLDGSAVERIGVAGLQVLLSARQDAAGMAVTLVHPSEALLAAARTIGAASLMASMSEARHAA